MDIPSSVSQLASSKGVPIRYYNIIYKLFDDLHEEITERLDPLVVDDILGIILYIYIMLLLFATTRSVVK